MSYTIEDIGFTKPNWKNISAGNDDLYYGQLPPNWREELNKVLDDQKDTMVDIEDINRKKTLPKQIAIFGGGLLFLLTVIVIIKYSKK